VHFAYSPPLQLLEQHGQRPVDDLRKIAAGHGMAQQILNAAKLVVRVVRDRELNPIPFRRKRRDERAKSGRGPDRRLGGPSATWCRLASLWPLT
jgi:hypothetical protein